ncbi:MAG: glutamine synthetase [Chloroflexi bacterium]|nr:MAG: glutamine synthetase [Chloroflexota bacterium]TMF40414.1 MAG: glutamine synthetase [Chloroflexota bacterium]
MQMGDAASEGSLATLSHLLEQTATTYVRCQFIDYLGLGRGREVSAEYLQRYSERGVAMAPVNYTWDIEDHDYDRRYGPEAGDVFLVADPSSFVALPYLKGNGHVFCDVITADGSPWPGCTRQLLKRIVAQAEQNLGVASMGFEQEGFLLKKDADGFRPATGFRHHTSDLFDVHQAFMSELLDVLQQLGTPVEKFNVEDGNGQIELDVKPGPPLVAAEQYFRLKQAFRFVARQHGFVGGFMPKPFDNISGSGLHLHLSLHDSTGSPIFGDAGTGDRDGLAERARHFIGGLLAHAPALVALGCPSVNSYKRLRPGLFAPTHAAFGIGNRSAMIRVLRTRTGSGADPGQRIELRAADGTCNPHLLAAAVLVAGLDGVARAVDPGASIAADIGNLPAATLATAGIRQLPVNLSEALDGLEADATFRDAFGTEIIAGFLRVKRLEWSKYNAHVSDWEYARYADAF